MRPVAIVVLAALLVAPAACAQETGERGVESAEPVAPAAGVEPVAAARPVEPDGEAVVMLHGLNSGPLQMKVLGWRLGKAGFSVHAFEYSSHAESIDEMTAEVHQQFLACCAGRYAGVHFVTHSLGGLVLRAWLADHLPPEARRAVLLAPPNRGSEIVDELGEWPLFEKTFGPLATELGTGADDLPQTLPALPIEFGVIAGSRGVNPVGAAVVPSPHDGTVSVDSTRLDGMRDHLVVPHTHPFMMNSSEVAEQVVSFLRVGHFLAPAEPPSP